MYSPLEQADACIYYLINEERKISCVKKIDTPRRGVLFRADAILCSWVCGIIRVFPVIALLSRTPPLLFTWVGGSRRACGLGGNKGLWAKRSR